MTAEQRRAQYVADKAARRCVACRRPLAEGDGVHCKQHAEMSARRCKRYRGRRKVSLIDSHRRASLYWSNIDVWREMSAARRTQKKIDGICLDCPAPSLDDNVRCGPCRDRCNEGKTGRITKPDRYTPVDAVVDLPRTRVLRAARHLDWFSGAEMNELLGNAEDKSRNNLSQMLHRLAKSGCLERRDVDPGPEFTGLRGNGSTYEYRITATGISELETALSTGKTVGGLRRAA